MPLVAWVCERRDGPTDGLAVSAERARAQVCDHSILGGSSRARFMRAANALCELSQNDMLCAMISGATRTRGVPTPRASSSESTTPHET